MSSPTVEFSSRDLARLTKALHEVNTAASRELTREIKKALEPVAGRVRRYARALPADTAGADAKFNSRKWDKRPMGLRQAIAASVVVKVARPTKGASAAIRISGKQFAKFTAPPGGQGDPRLPRYMEGWSRKPWRHPVFADKGKDRGTWTGAWASQEPKPYLTPAIEPYEDTVRDDLMRRWESLVTDKLRQNGITVR